MKYSNTKRIQLNFGIIQNKKKEKIYMNKKNKNKKKNKKKKKKQKKIKKIKYNKVEFLSF